MMEGYMHNRTKIFQGPAENDTQTESCTSCNRWSCLEHNRLSFWQKWHNPCRMHTVPHRKNCGEDKMGKRVECRSRFPCNLVYTDMFRLKNHMYLHSCKKDCKSYPTDRHAHCNLFRQILLDSHKSRLSNRMYLHSCKEGHIPSDRHVHCSRFR